MTEKTDSEIAVELAIEAKRRAENCSIDVKNAERKWNCKINSIVVISGKGISTYYEIVPLEILRPT